MQYGDSFNSNLGFVFHYDYISIFVCPVVDIIFIIVVVS